MIRNADREARAPQSIPGVVIQWFTKHLSARHKNVAGIEGADVDIAQLDGSNNASQIAGLDQIAELKWTAKCQKKSSEKVLADFTKRETQDDGDYTASRQKAGSDAVQTHDTQSKQDTYRANNPADEASQKLLGWPVNACCAEGAGLQTFPQFLPRSGR